MGKSCLSANHDGDRDPVALSTGAGSSGQDVRALCVPYVGGTYGLSRLITVSRNRCLHKSCSSQALNQTQMPLADLRSGMDPAQGRGSGGSLGDSGMSTVSRPIGAEGVAGQRAGVQVGQRVGCSTWTPALWPAPRKLADATGYLLPFCLCCTVPTPRVPLACH
jgi:hypothetical protein